MKKNHMTFYMDINDGFILKHEVSIFFLFYFIMNFIFFSEKLLVKQS